MNGAQPHSPMRFHNLNIEICIFIFPFRTEERNVWALSVLEYGIRNIYTQYPNLEGIGFIFHPNIWRRQFPSYMLVSIYQHTQYVPEYLNPDLSNSD
jgi:hypothetical protein